MNELLLTLLLDIFMATLLATTIYFCIKLNKRVKVLQDSKSELAHLIQQFDISTQQATISISEIQKASKKINENIQTKLDKANYLADDLAFMIERANKTVDLMDGKTSARTSAARPAPVSESGDASRASAKKSGLLSKATVRSGDVIPPQERSDDKSSRKTGGIEAMMDRISELKGGGQTAAPRAKRATTRLRTKSEKDLMSALNNKTNG